MWFCHLAFSPLVSCGKPRLCQSLKRKSNLKVTLEFLHTSLQPALQTTAELRAMYSVDQPAEVVSWQGRYEGQPGQHGQHGQPGQPGQHGQHGQPGVATAVQYTTVNMPAELPKDHIIWSLLCFVYSNPCCLGLAALIFSIKVSLYVADFKWHHSCAHLLFF